MQPAAIETAAGAISAHSDNSASGSFANESHDVEGAALKPQIVDVAVLAPRVVDIPVTVVPSEAAPLDEAHVMKSFFDGRAIVGLFCRAGTSGQRHRGSGCGKGSGQTNNQIGREHV